MVPPWFSNIKPEPVYENEQVKLTWDTIIYTTNTITHNKQDVTLWDKVNKEVTLIEMSVVWFKNIQARTEEKTQKYTPLRAELARDYHDYSIKQISVVMDILGGHTRELQDQNQELLVPHCSNCVIL